MAHNPDPSPISRNFGSPGGHERVDNAQEPMLYSVPLVVAVGHVRKSADLGGPRYDTCTKCVLRSRPGRSLFGGVLTTAPAWAQATAELNGRVTDSSGAVLPGVTVTATQTADRTRAHRRHRRDGDYLMPNLPTGPYRLEVIAAGVPHATCRRARAARSARRRRSTPPSARQARGDGHGGSGGAARGRPQRRHQRGGRERADRRAPAPGAPGHRSDRARGRGGADRHGRQPRACRAA